MFVADKITVPVLGSLGHNVNGSGAFEEKNAASCAKAVLKLCLEIHDSRIPCEVERGAKSEQLV